jgi:hypothetical protein
MPPPRRPRRRCAIIDLLGHPAIKERVREGLVRMKQQGGGSSTYPARAMLLAEPPVVEAGEITDKGYINQRAVLTRRADLCSNCTPTLRRFQRARHLTVMYESSRRQIRQSLPFVVHRTMKGEEQ